MPTVLLIEIGWFIVLASSWVWLLSSKRLPAALVRAWVAFLLLGLWYGALGSGYAWAYQWSVYTTGILFLWAWLALTEETTFPRRWEPQAGLLGLGLLGTFWHLRPSHLLVAHTPPPFTEVALVWTQRWAPLFALATLALVGFLLLLAMSWRTYLPSKMFR